MYSLSTRHWEPSAHGSPESSVALSSEVSAAVAMATPLCVTNIAADSSMESTRMPKLNVNSINTARMAIGN
eukprot:CAMPEP_0204400926 /NCGR_PEP_ID=MMETSP0470-20130426/4346_1 /ASSEMBLY_ACC=CAM_ASM_000385 /TAXON_ID=2969 /ORGANISM="Oxyrrhis marina" /LENGTH=70 /DNA_ID=CAMNT_0051395821 /DNA_START=176 /DNA_END=388 /DNA_ORIENTATION=+